LEANADGEVGHPIYEHGDGHGRRPRTLTEELRSNHPRYGARTNGKEYDKSKYGYDS